MIRKSSFLVHCPRRRSIILSKDDYVKFDGQQKFIFYQKCHHVALKDYYGNELCPSRCTPP